MPITRRVKGAEVGREPISWPATTDSIEGGEIREPIESGGRYFVLNISLKYEQLELSR